MKLWHLQGESVDLWFPDEAKARAQGETLFREKIICTVRQVALPRSKEVMCDFLNTIGGCCP